MTRILAERIERLDEKTIKSGDGQRTHCGNDNMHTHAHVELQFGALIWATAKPEKKTKNASALAMRVILCLAALRVVGLKGTGMALKSDRMMDGSVEAF